MAILWRADRPLKLNKGFSFEDHIDYFGHMIQPAEVTLWTKRPARYVDYIFQSMQLHPVLSLAFARSFASLYETVPA